MADTRISQLPDTAVQDDALVVPVVETAGATKTTKRQSVGTMLSGRAKTDLSNLDEDLTPSEQSTIRDRIGAHAGGTGAVDFDSLASDLRDAVEKSVAVGGISLTDRNVEFVSDDATHFAITLPREMPDPAVGDAGKHSRVNDTEDGYELVDAPREVPAGGVSGQVVKRTATGYEWGADAGLSEAEVKAEIRPEAQVDLAALSSVQQAAARMRIGASSGAGHDGVETLEVRATPPPAADYSRGDVIDVGGALYELVADDADASVVSGAAAATSGVYVGGPLFEWSPTASGHALIRALLPKSALGAPPPAGLAFLYRDSTGYTLREASYPGTAVGLRRDSSRDTRTHYGYATPATGERIPTAAGARYRVDFFEPETSTAAQFSRRRTVHDADRWELVDRGLTATIDARIESGVGVANGALPTTLPRPAGSAASPPSVRAVTAALDASLTDGAAAWGPARNYDAAASLRAVADGDYHRAGDRELVIDPHSGDRKLLLAAHAIRIGGAACSASITAHGHGVAHKRSAPVAVGQGTDVERFEGRTGGVLRVHSVALPREGDVVSFNRVNRGTVNVTERYRVIKAGNGWFEIYEGTVLTEAADDDGRWFTVAVGGFTGDVADVTAASRVPAVQSGRGRLEADGRRCDGVRGRRRSVDHGDGRSRREHALSRARPVVHVHHHRRSEDGRRHRHGARGTAERPHRHRSSRGPRRPAADRLSRRHPYGQGRNGGLVGRAPAARGHRVDQGRGRDRGEGRRRCGDLLERRSRRRADGGLVGLRGRSVRQRGSVGASGVGQSRQDTGLDLRNLVGGPDHERDPGQQAVLGVE